MAPLRPLRFREVKRKRESAGFTEMSQRGSHVKFVKRDDGGVRTAVVPRHREVVVGTLRSIMRQAGLSQDEFDAL
ncbi:MAG: type II toxin-antitoxin system HicA family toxin [SAR202 cluster bacterium]|nr:type II toxin-antitoxin system HicA family toxin [SAR202 cluster bacterium]MDP6665423.1 type II toxin-antitoxin system HicA family toxin [SAR202 cluster bacterium]MDP6798217.1 type II toxin-antitoxin system HicA family toxin [SAR202 cluster bacterium]